MITKKKLNFKTFQSFQWKISSIKNIDYSIIITKNLFDKKNNLLEDKKKNLSGGRRLVFIDTNVNIYYQKKNRKLFFI